MKKRQRSLAYLYSLAPPSLPPLDHHQRTAYFGWADGPIERIIGLPACLLVLRNAIQSEKDRQVSWESVCRVLAVMLAVADNPRSGAGRVGLLLGGAIEALMPCLGLPKPEVIRSALEVGWFGCGVAALAFKPHGLIINCRMYVSCAAEPFLVFL